MLLTGPDVSWWSDRVDWSRVAGTHAFGWCYATGGPDFVHRQFADHLAGMRAAELVPGAIHRLSQFSAGRADARCFVRYLGDPRGLLAAVDVDGDRFGRPTIDQVADFAHEWYSLTGDHPLLIRTSWRSWAPRDGTSRGWRISPHLWHTTPRNAHHAIGRTPTYGGWSSPTLWQHIPAGRCPGIRGVVGLNILYGAEQTLAELAGAELPTNVGSRHHGPLRDLVSRLVDRYTRQAGAGPGRAA